MTFFCVSTLFFCLSTLSTKQDRGVIIGEAAGRATFNIQLPQSNNNDNNELIAAEEAGRYAGAGIAPYSPYRGYDSARNTDNEHVRSEAGGTINNMIEHDMSAEEGHLTSAELAQQIYRAKQVVRRAEDQRDQILEQIRAQKEMMASRGYDAPWYTRLSFGKVVSSGFTASIAYSMFFIRVEDYRIRRLAVGLSFLMSLIYCVAVKQSPSLKKGRERNVRTRRKL